MMFRMELDALNAIVKELREIKMELLEIKELLMEKQPHEVVTPVRREPNDHEQQNTVTRKRGGRRNSHHTE